MDKKKLHIDGMYCHACEVLIERKLKKVEGVHKVKVHRGKKEVTYFSDTDVPIDEMQKVLPDKYQLSYEKTARDVPKGSITIKKSYVEIGVFLLIILGIYLLLSYFDLVPSNFNLSDNMSYGFIFVIGLIASTSSCLAVSGGLLLAIATKFNAQHPELSGWQKFKPHIYFNVGRIISYTLLGGVIGLIGSAFSLSLFANGVITIFASLFMVIIGLQLLHIFPFLDHFQIKMPKFIAHKVHDVSEDGESTYSNAGAFLFGGATFFLPCGFTQALQLYVLAQGNFMVGALTMLAFSIGTLPALASISAISSFAKGSFQRHFLRFSAILIIVLGIFSLQYGFALTGLFTGEDTQDTTDFVPMIDGVQIAEMRVEGLSYYPHQFKVREGVPVKWIIDGAKARGCGQIIIAPKIGVREYLSSTPNVVEFTPTQEGTIPFSCTMGMTTRGAQFEVVAG